MNQTLELLTKIGLNDTEATIYLAGLGFVSIGVSELEKQTQIKRTTIYHALDTLLQKGMAAKKNDGKRTLFNMAKPEQLQQLINRQIKLLEQSQAEVQAIVPLLNSRLPEINSGINITHYEGIEGIKLVVEEALYARRRHWDIIAPVKNFFSEFDKAYAKYYIEARRTRSITARTLWEHGRDNEKISPEERRWRNPRYLPAVMQGHFKSVIILFDNKVAIISSFQEKSAILMQSQELADTFGAMFEGLWTVSRE
jgi:sugar-specific transcriptional regulator TrmB